MKIFKKLLDTKVSTSYMFILFGISGLMLMGYFSYAWFTVQGVQQYSVVTGTLNGTVAIGSNSITINGSGVITYTPSTDNDTITLIVTNTNDRTVKNSIYYYDLSDSSIEIGYASDSPTIPTVEGVSVAASKSLTYKIKIKGANGKQIKIGSSMGLSNSNLTLPSGTTAFSLLSDPTGAETLVAKANVEDLDYNTATDDQKNQMWTFSHEETEQLGAITDYRYIGANPNNYVKFNDELWRIIGVFDTDDGTGKIEKRMKIIRNRKIGSYSWDYTVSGSSTNDWKTSTLNALLNDGPYYNRTTGYYYNNSTNATFVNFTSNGLTDIAKEMIGDAKWYLGGIGDYYGSTTIGLVSQFYKNERGTSVYTGRSTSWVGKVGLIYSSDYGYATSGNGTTTRLSCQNTSLSTWDKFSGCYSNDWLLRDSIIWTISPSSASNNNVFDIYGAGNIQMTQAWYNEYHDAWPIVYLKSTINITSGTGSSTDPFILSE